MKICRICGKEFEPKVYNATICYDKHYTTCRICGKKISLDGDKNKLKRKMYLQKGFAYCSHICSNKGIGLDKQEQQNKNIDLDKLKLLYEQTSLFVTEIAQILDTNVDFVHSRIKSLNLVRPENLVKQSIERKNNKISNVLLDKYKDNAIKQEMLNKAKQTYYNKTGYESNLQNPESREKAKKTKLEKYGNENYINIDKMKQTRKTKNNGKFWTKEQLLQSKETKIRLYGNGCNFKKMIETKIKRYNNPYFVNKDAIQDTWNNKTDTEKNNIFNKGNNTKLKRYGNLNNYNKIQETCLERYNVDNIFQLPEIQEKIKETNLKKYGTMYPVTLFSYLNNKTISKINKNFNEKLISIGLKTQLEKVVENNSFDIFVEPNILIEINPTYTHNSTIGPYIGGKQVKCKDSNYHYNKTQIAKNNNYKCIHIFDWDNYDKIINSLKPKINLYARKLKIKEVDKNICKEFLNKYHFQNNCNNQDIRLGLFDNTQLVQIMTFGKPRYNKNYEYELLRLCTDYNYYIIGGTEKLFKYFLRTYKPKSIISYCDYSKFSGGIYEKLGFTLKQQSINTHWYNMKTKRHITDNLLRQRGFSQLHNDNNYKLYKKGDNNEELMLNNGYVQVYDCGQGTYVWNK